MLIRRVSPQNLVWYESALLQSAGVAHAFSTRLGGVSLRPFDSLNLGNPSGCEIQDSQADIEENYRRLLAAIGLAGHALLKVRQVHGNQVVVAQSSEPLTASADAIVLNHDGPVASVRVADCVPVLLATADGSAVAAVHAGWRGTVGGIVAVATAKLRQLRPGQPIVAAIGPCIGPDAFEVGPEVLAQFVDVFGCNAPIRRRPDGKGYVDLPGALRRQLRADGLSDEQIDSTDRCTFRDAAEFFSHRRDNGITGRMAAVISTRPQAIA